LQLCNSIIARARLQEEVTKYKEKYCLSVTEELGHGDWRCFLKRNKNLMIKKVVKLTPSMPSGALT
jgi:hypothetical protein